MRFKLLLSLHLMSNQQNLYVLCKGPQQFFVFIAGLIIVCYISKTPFSEPQRLEMIRYLRSVMCPDGGWGL